LAIAALKTFRYSRGFTNKSAIGNWQSAMYRLVLGLTHTGGNFMGWDGDDLAGQAEDESERQEALAEARVPRPNLTPEGRARNSEVESLRLSRARVLAQLANATNPSHRRMLESALHSIDEKMRD